MKIVATIARLLLGLEFAIFGLNGFLQFLHMPPPTGLAGQFLMVIFVSHYSVAIFAFQLVGGAILLTGRYIPLALTILAPVLMNILLFHLLLAPQGLPLALLTTVLWLLVFVPVRHAFAGLLTAKA